MPHFTVVTGILAFVALDIIVVWLVMGTVLRLTWNALADRFPAQDPAPGAVRRDFQSIAIGFANFGLCTHLAADEAALHLRPAMFLRLFRARGISVPWDQVVFKRKRRVLGATYVEVLIGKIVLTGPEWCLGLAGEPPEPL